MKIAHLDFENYLRGGQKQIMYLLEGLRAGGVSCVLFGRAGSPLFNWALERGFPAYGYRFLSVYDPFFINRLRKDLFREKPDAVHFHSGHAHTAGYLAIPEGSPIKKLLTRRVPFILKNDPFTKKKYSALDMSVAISAYIKTMLERRMPVNKIAFIRSAVSFPERPVRKAIPEGVEQEQFKIAVASALKIGRDKDFRTLFSAMKILHDPRITMMVFGCGPDEKKIKKMAEDLGVSKDIVFAGFKDDMFPYLKGADIFVHSVFNEALGTSIIEAMFCGLPVIASAAGGIPEVVHNGENGFLFEPGNASMLADMIIHLKNDEVLRKEISERNRKAGEDFSSERMVRSYLELYRNLTEGNGA